MTARRQCLPLTVNVCPCPCSFWRLTAERPRSFRQLTAPRAVILAEVRRPAFGGGDWVRGESRGTSGIAFTPLDSRGKPENDGVWGRV